MPRVIPDLALFRVQDLPVPASAYDGEFRRTAAGVFWSNGLDWRRVDAPGLFWPITEADLAELPPEDLNDPTIIWLTVEDPSLLRPTSTWLEVTAEPGSPDPGTLYLVNP
jgi:hypothetical protein